MPMPRNNPGDVVLAAEWNQLADQIDTNTEDIAALNGALFPYLKTGGGSLSTAIQTAFNTGVIGIGDAIRTASYFENSDLGGAIYRLVAPGTGTQDGGLFIDFTGFQLKAVIAEEISAASYGFTAGASAAANASTLTSAINAAFDSGKKLTLPAGTFAVGAISITKATAGVVEVVGTSNTKLQLTGGIRLQSTWTSLSATAIVLSDSHTFPNSSSPKISTKITLPLGHGVAVGDLVKVTSEDNIPEEGRFAVKSGQFVHVSDVVGNDIWTSSKLRAEDIWTTSIKVWKIPQVQARFQNLVIDMVNSTDIGLGFYGVVRPILRDVHFTNLGNSGAWMVGCYAPIVDITAAGMQSVSPIYPYAVAVANTESGVFDITARGVRHAFTTAANDTTASGWTYGRAAHHIVRGHAIACLGGFDTHQDGFDVTFDSCIASDCIAGQDAPGVGFGARGVDITFNNCTVDGASTGFLIYAEADSVTKRIRLLSPKTRNIEKIAVSIVGVIASGNTITDTLISDPDLQSDQYAVLANANNVDIRISGGKIEVRTSFYRHLQSNISGAKITAENVHLICNGPQSPFYAAANSFVTARRCSASNILSATYSAGGAGLVRIDDFDAGGSTRVLDPALALGSYVQYYTDPFPLYAITGYTATLPPRTMIKATYADMTALTTAIQPIFNGQLIQVAGAPSADAVGIFRAAWVSGSWSWNLNE